MKLLNVTSEELVNKLLSIPKEKKLHLLDSCSFSDSSRYLIAGFSPVSVIDITAGSPEEVLENLREILRREGVAFVFTVSYEFGLRLNKILPRRKEFRSFSEPYFSVAVFDFLIIHDYLSKQTFLIGNSEKFCEVEKQLRSVKEKMFPKTNEFSVFSDFDRIEYERSVEKIKEFIRRGETYQVNLTRQIVIEASKNLSSERIFLNIRKNHPVPFACLLRRKRDDVVSASPERFFRIQGRSIFSSPIKGTRRRGSDQDEDRRLKEELMRSEKDRSENVMIVDLVRNDLGRICEFGSIRVQKLCKVEEYATLFQMVSTISGELRANVSFSDVIKAVFPCGSITGAPKVRTMQIIDLLERSNRGISMGAIGYIIPSGFATELFGKESLIDCSVAIRTMNINGKRAIFKVGGGIVIESEASSEYEETIIKSKALIDAICS